MIQWTHAVILSDNFILTKAYGMPVPKQLNIFGKEETLPNKLGESLE